MQAGTRVNAGPAGQGQARSAEDAGQCRTRKGARVRVLDPVRGNRAGPRPQEPHLGGRKCDSARPQASWLAEIPGCAQGGVHIRPNTGIAGDKTLDIHLANG